ncbi:MAG: hypothetical protein Q7R79_03225 [bacterium]|nr:hypothetical protein [bacterium]
MISELRQKMQSSVIKKIAISLFVFFGFLGLAFYGLEKSDAANFCIRGECLWYVDQYENTGWDLKDVAAYHNNGGKNRWWQKESDNLGYPRYCWRNICKDRLWNKPPVLEFVLTQPSDGIVKKGQGFKLEWTVIGSGETTLKRWCDYCSNRDTEQKATVQDVTNLPYGEYSGSIPSSNESPKYTFKLEARNEAGTVSKIIVLKPSDNFLNAAAKIAGDSENALVEGVKAVAKKVAECVGKVGGILGKKLTDTFADPIGLALRLGAMIGSNALSGGVGSVIKAACQTTLTTAGAAAFGIGAAITYPLGIIMCPLVEEAFWTAGEATVDFQLCLFGADNLVIPGVNIKVTGSLIVQAIRIVTDIVAGWDQISQIFTKGWSGFTEWIGKTFSSPTIPSTTPTNIITAAGDIIKNAVLVVGSGCNPDTVGQICNDLINKLVKKSIECAATTTGKGTRAPNPGELSADTLSKLPPGSTPMVSNGPWKVDPAEARGWAGDSNMVASIAADLAGSAACDALKKYIH